MNVFPSRVPVSLAITVLNSMMNLSGKGFTEISSIPMDVNGSMGTRVGILFSWRVLRMRCAQTEYDGLKRPRADLRH